MRDFTGKAIKGGQWLLYPVRRSSKSAGSAAGYVIYIDEKAVVIRKSKGGLARIRNAQRCVILPHPDRLLKIQYSDDLGSHDCRFPIWRGDLTAQIEAQGAEGPLSVLKDAPEAIADLEKTRSALFESPWDNTKYRCSLVRNPGPCSAL